MVIGHIETTDPRLSLPLCWGSGTLPRIPFQAQDSFRFPGWFVGMRCYPHVELIYVEFYLPPHLDISQVIIATLYMPTHSAQRHIHQGVVTGYSFINDQIHFCRITALWCMRNSADAGPTSTQTPTTQCVARARLCAGVRTGTLTQPHSIKKGQKLWSWGRVTGGCVLTSSHR